MNAQRITIENERLWACQICGAYGDSRTDADACCSQQIAKSDPLIGRQPIKKKEGYVPWPITSVEDVR